MPKLERDGISANEVKLKRDLGLFEVVMYGIGIILGAGIYALLGKAAGVAGPALWMSFAVGAVIAAITGLSYAELGAMYPKESAEYLYSKKAFRSTRLSFVLGWLLIFLGSIGAATVALGFGGYLFSLTGIPIIASALGLIAVLTALNFWGIKESSKANIIFTIIELAGLLIIIAIGMTHLQPVEYYTFMPNGFSGIFLGAILIFFAYLGFENIGIIAEEMKNPRKNLPRALLIAILVTSLIYVLVSIAAVSIVPWDVLGASTAPLADVARNAFPGGYTIMAAIALFATANTVLILLISASRITWGMANQRCLPKKLSKVHTKRRTPWVTILITGALAAAFVFMGNIKTVAEITDFGAFLVFFCMNVAVIVLRYNRPKDVRPFKVPFTIGRFPILPALGAVFCLGMLFFFATDVIMVSVAIIVAGLFIYQILRMKGVADDCVD